jgi:uncharacterized membrane protein
MTNLLFFLVGHCNSCHVIYRSDYTFDMFKLFLLVIVFPVMWFTVLITTMISSNFSCWSLYFLSCDIQFWWPLWYLQTFLVGHCISCHVIYSSDDPFDIFKLFLLVIVLPVMWFTVLITPLISSNFSCWSLYFLSYDLRSVDGQYNDQQERFEDIKGVIRTVNHMTGNTMTNKKSLKISKG